MTRREILVQARDLISEREKWTKHAWTTEGYDRAPKFCAVGAIKKVVTGDGSPRNYYLQEEAIPVQDATHALGEVLYGAKGAGMPWNGVPAYNDSHPHECILELFDAAIEREEQNEQAT